MSQHPAEYVAARRVLLDALEALESHLDSVILVGAQAVYLHTGEGSLNVPVMTTDADLALDASGLHDSPEIASLMQNAGFTPGLNPGHWLGAGEVAVDVMVVPHQANPARADSRTARLPSHGKQTARITPGLEPALLDKSPRTIVALDSADARIISVNVAGPAALMVAKLIKISERLDSAQRGRSNRLREKDALDVLRLLQEVETTALVEGLARHTSETHSARASTTATQFLREYGMSPAGKLARLAAEAVPGDATISVSFAVLATQLVAAVEAASWAN